MRLCSRAVLPAILLILVSAASLLADDLPDFLQREGSFFAAFQAPLSSQVYLDAVVVDKIKGQNSPPYFTVRELFAPSEKLVILSQPSSLLKLGQVIDVEGTLTSLPSGELELENVTVWGYAGETGALVDGPLKGLYSRTLWDNNMIDLTVASDYYSGSSSNMTASDSFSNEEPNTSPLPSPTFYNSIGDLLAAGSAQPQTNNRMSPQTYYDGIGDISGSDGDPVEIGCDAITEVGSDSTYFVATDSSGSIPVYCTTDRLAGVTTDDRVSHLLGQLRHVGDDPVICINDGPGYDPNSVANPLLQIVKAGGISWAKTFADSTTLPSSLTDKTVSQAFPTAGYFYIQEPMRQSGIRVYSQSAASSVSPGTVVTVSGAISTQDGERMITASNVVATSSTDAPMTLGMTNKALGGGPVNTYTAGITGCQEMPNQGLLARIWGKVTYSDANYFYLDDGSNIDNGTGNPLGVKISWAWHGNQDGDVPIAAPGQDWYVSASGISSSELSSGQTVRVLRLRRQEDLKIVTPEDSSKPYVDITTPPDGQLTLAYNSAGSYSAVISGTAKDADTGVVKVEVGFTTTTDTTGPTAWYRADMPSSQTWTYNWISPTTSKIWVRATDFNRNVTDPPYTKVVNVTVPTAANVIYVDSSRPNDNGNGLTWGTAKQKVTSGLTAASSGQEVWVAKGTYPERTTLKSGVGLYGGFVGGATNGETYREQRNWAANKTILDGSSGGTVVTGGSGATAANTVIDGFTIQNGKAWGGAGMSFSSGAATVSHNIIRLNSSPTTGSGRGTGVGIYCSGTSPAIANNWIVGNLAYASSNDGAGGAIYLSNSNAIIINNTIAHNSANNGGAIYVTGSGYSPTITNNIIAFNSSGIYTSSGTPAIAYNDVWANANDGSDTHYWKLGTPETNHNISADPLMASSILGDLRITSGSPCKDAGLDTVTLPDSQDISGNSRKNGLIDIGANEWSGVNPVSSPLVVRVKPNGADSNDGSSWTLAKKTIQAAITYASSKGGGEVWVKGSPNLGLIYNEALTMYPFVHVYGGFDESCSLHTDRNWRQNLTAIDASGLGTPVVTVSAVPMLTSTLDGFTIAHGNGGIKLNYGSAVISHNIIKGNTVSGQGAGIYATGSQPVITNNWVIANSAMPVSSSSGGGMYLYSCQGLVVVNNTIVGNTATGPGGIYAGYSPLANVTNNIVANNTSGILIEYSNSATAKSNDLYNNPGDTAPYTSYLQPGSDGNISVDPGFLDAAHCDFHITGSGCKNNGLDTVSLPDNLDIDGDIRRNGQIDIGADEWNGVDPSPTTPRVIHVKPGGDDNNDGSSWTLAKQTIQKALNAASDTGSGEVWVEGSPSGITYSEPITTRPGVYLYGGFDESDNYCSDRDWASNITIIKGSSSSNTVTAQAIPNQWATVDGFTITGGSRGIYCWYGSPLISHNKIMNNGSTSGTGGGIYCQNASPTIVNNWVTNNTALSGAGIICQNSSASIINNTIAENSSSSTSGGIYIWGTGSCPVIENNVVALNSTGIYVQYDSGVSPTIAYNDVYGNSGDTSSYWEPSTTLNGPPDANHNIIKNPGFMDIDNNDFHISWSSGCKNAGLDSVSLPDAFDIDKDSRRSGTIDIGADEATECRHYKLTLTAQAIQTTIGASTIVTARVFDPATNQPPAPGFLVNFSVNAGVILSISPNGQVSQSETSGYGTTDADGYVYAYVTRNTKGPVAVTANITYCSSSMIKTSQIYFGTDGIVDLVFVVDVTPSLLMTGNGSERVNNGIKSTIEYLCSQLQAQGRSLRVAGIKFSDWYLYPISPSYPHSNGVLRDFATMTDTNAISALESWIAYPGPPGGGLEYTLDILMIAKDLAPDAHPGLYIALLTDEDSDSTLDKNTVAAALAQSGSIVFIDPGQQTNPDAPYESLPDYYSALAVNGGCVETATIGMFTFPTMRQAILDE